MGTYLWGPDELEAMARIGNAHAERVYCGGVTQRPAPGASYEELERFARDKYDKKNWYSASAGEKPSKSEDVKKVAKATTKKVKNSKRKASAKTAPKQEVVTS